MVMAMLDPAYLESIGVFQAPDGSYKRTRLRVVDVEYDPDDPKAEQKGRVLGYDLEEVPYPVVLPLSTDPAAIERARAEAAATGADFHHPRFGWLRWGVKREAEHPDNLGAGAVTYPRRRVDLAGAAPARGGRPSPRKDQTS